MLYKFFLKRRRIDGPLFAFAIACLIVDFGPEIILLSIFAGIGIWLVAGRHRSSRRIPRAYAIPVIIYLLVCTVIALIQWPDPAELQAESYPLLFAFGIFLPVGLVLVRDPLRWLVLGARLGLAAALLLGVWEFFSTGTRIGFGGNAASAAFLIAVGGVIARVELDKDYAFLPNSRLWIYLAGFVLLMTGTRALLPIMLFALLIDAFSWWKGRRRLHRNWVLAQFTVVLLLVGGSGFVLGDAVQERFAYTIADIETAFSDSQELSSTNIRFMQWDAALEVIRQHPIFGLGAVQSMEEINEAVPEEHRSRLESFNHVHNFLLDETRIRGAVGLAALLFMLGTVFVRLMQVGTSEVRQATVLLYAAVLLYGSLHGVFLTERNIILYAAVVSLLLFSATESLAKERHA